MAESERFALPLEDREEHDGGADVGPMMRRTSSNAPEATRASAPAPTM
jgi:hypothetical protein